MIEDERRRDYSIIVDDEEKEVSYKTIYIITHELVWKHKNTAIK